MGGVLTGTICFMKRCRSLEKLDSKMRMGRMVKRMASGDRLIQWAIDLRISRQCA
jgi:hypothetical protein